MKVFYCALIFLFSLHPLLAETLDQSKCEAYKKGAENQYTNCLKNKENHPCEIVNHAKSWKEVVKLLKEKGVIENPSTLVEYTFDGENIEYTITYEKGTMMAEKYGIRKIPGYIKMINENEVEYSLLKPLDGPCKGVTNKVSCFVVGNLLTIGFEGKPDICGIITYLEVELDMMKSEKTFSTRKVKKP